MGHPTMQENDTAKLTPTTKVRFENMMAFNGRFSVDVNEVTAFR